MSQKAEAVSHLALDWLREILHTEFDGAPAFRRTGTASAASEADTSHPAPRRGSISPADPFEVALRFSRGEAGTARWYRDWHRGWRRFQLPERLQRYAESLLAATSAEEVYQALTEHAVQVVGGYTSVLFPPQSALPLRSIPNPALTFAAGRLTLSSPLGQPGTIHRDEVLSGGPFDTLSPLFTEANAVTVAHAPFSDGGLILLVERRRERVFTEEDREMLRVLSTLAGAALARVRLAKRSDVAADAQERTGVLEERLLEPVLEHAMYLARQDEPLTLVAMRLIGLARVRAEDGPASAARACQAAAAALRELSGSLGIVLKHGADGYFLVLPRLSPPQAGGLVERLRRQLPKRIELAVGVAEHGGAEQSPTELTAAALDALARDAEALESASPDPLTPESGSLLLLERARSATCVR